MVDVLVGRPSAEVLRDLAIDREVERALLYGEGSLARIVALAVAHEQGDWAALGREAAALGVDERRTAEIFLESSHWAHEVIARTASTGV